MLRVMHRSVWLAFAAVLVIGLLGAFLLGRALEKTTVVTTPSFAPRGAQVLEDRALGGSLDRRVVTWRIGGHPEEPSSALYGVTIWQAHRALYSHRARTGAHGLTRRNGRSDGRWAGRAHLRRPRTGPGVAGSTVS